MVLITLMFALCISTGGALRISCVSVSVSCISGKTSPTCSPRIPCGIVSFTFITDHWLETIFISSVVDNLTTPVGEKNVILTLSLFTLARFLVTKVITGFGIVDLPRELIVGRLLEEIEKKD